MIILCYITAEIRRILWLCTNFHLNEDNSEITKISFIKSFIVYLKLNLHLKIKLLKYLAKITIRRTNKTVHPPFQRNKLLKNLSRCTN